MHPCLHHLPSPATITYTSLSPSQTQSSLHHLHSHAFLTYLTLSPSPTQPSLRNLHGLVYIICLTTSLICPSLPSELPLSPATPLLLAQLCPLHVTSPDSLLAYSVLPYLLRPAATPSSALRHLCSPSFFSFEYPGILATFSNLFYSKRGKQQLQCPVP